VFLGTCESAVCVRIEYESNRALRFESYLESTRPYIPLITFHDGLTVAISIPPIQFVHCGSAGLPHMLCYVTRVGCCVCNFVDLWKSAKITSGTKEMRGTTDSSFQSSNTLKQYRRMITHRASESVYFRIGPSLSNTIESEQPIRIWIESRSFAGP